MANHHIFKNSAINIKTLISSLVIIALCFALLPIPVIAQTNDAQSTDNFDETGIEPSANTSKSDTDNLTASKELASFFNDKERELSQLETLLESTCSSSDCSHCKKTYGIKKSQFESLWLAGKLPEANHIFDEIRNLLLAQLFGTTPAHPKLAARAIWLDRGSIVNAGSPEGLKTLLQRLKNSGFNVIFFETLNAGYTVYPSQYTQQNPLIKNWDPLAVAVEEGHHLGLEIHAWVWAFAVGNSRHNTVIGKPLNYAGPVLTNPKLGNIGLKTFSNSHFIPGQTEFWISPGKPEARKFLKNLYTEIVTKYDVDGLQLDYIRYPFQKGTGLAGFETQKEFEGETGIKLEQPSNMTLQAWNAWKAFQVSSFVKDISISLKRVNPKLTLSAAVFTLPRSRRMVLIQQDWETWLKNGWIDVLVPMAYSKTPNNIARLVDYVHEEANDRALIYPGVSLIRWNALQLVAALDTLEESGVMGTTLFANAQLKPATTQALINGPFKPDVAPILPHREPLKASMAAVKDLNTLVSQLVKPDANGKIIAPTELQKLSHHLEQINAELLTIEAKKASSQSQRLRIQSHLASLNNLLMMWKYTDNPDPLFKAQLRYLMPWVTHASRLVQYALNQNAI